MEVPKVIAYGNVKPRGFATKYKKWEVNPQSSFNSFSQGELVRFSLQTDGWIDPYSSYIEIEVETSQALCGGIADDPVHIEMDGQSTSLIEKMIIYSDSKELERMDEYDQVGQILNDLALQNLDRAHKTYEGMGFEKTHSNLSRAQDSRPTAVYQYYYDKANGNSYHRGCKSYSRSTNLLEQYRLGIPIGDAGGVATFQSSFTNMSQLSMNRLENIAEITSIYGIDALDSEFGVEHLQNKAKGSNESLQATSSNINYGCKVENSFSLSGNKSQYLNDQINTLKMVNGKFVQSRSVDTYITKDPASFIKKQRFIIPLLSGTLGILIPADQWKLIPGKALKNLMIEFRLNPYAFFTAGHYHPSGQLQKRGWKVTSFKMVFDMWNFDENVERIMDNALQGNGLILSSSSWSLGPMYQIIANGSVTNNWHINNGIESVKTLLFWFLSNDYLSYPHCRKNFRLSMNILQYQLKIGGDFIPPYPIKGHAGNIALNDVILEDNTNFLIELHKSFGFFFSATRDVKINKLNFAVNERSYDPNMENMTSLQLGCGSATNDTPVRGLNLPLVEERRAQGKAIYTINLDSNPTDPDVLSGLDITAKRPIELIIKGADTDKYPRDSTMYIMFNHDFYVQFTNEGTKCYGQG